MGKSIAHHIAKPNRRRGGRKEIIPRRSQPAFTNSFPPLKMMASPSIPFFLECGVHNKSIIAPSRATGAEIIMGTSGELIRLINYVDDITTTLRRINAFVAAMESDEKKRLAESLKVAGNNLDALVVRLEKGGQ